jgi:cell division protein FtsL
MKRLKDQDRVIRRGLLKKLTYPLASIILILGSIFIYLWSRIAVLEKGYHFSTLKSTYRILKEENKRLKLEKAEISSLESIEKIAREELGLIFPEDDQMVPVIIDESNQRITPDILYDGKYSVSTLSWSHGLH